VARAPKGADPEGFGLRLVRFLNLGTIAGLPVGLAAYFLANRLLPDGLGARADWEVRAFFAAWLVAALAASLYPRRRAWSLALAVPACAFLAIPLVDVILIGQQRFLAFDAAMAAVGLALGLAARLATRRGVAAARPAKVTLSRTVEA
jgi:hypothetical protein